MLMRDKEPASARNWTLLPPLSATTAASILVLCDTAAVFLSGFLTYDFLIVYSAAQNLYIVSVVFVWMTALSLMNFGGLYRYDAATHPARHLHGVVIAFATTFLFFLAAAFSIKVSETLSRVWLVSFATASIVLTGTLRLALSVLVQGMLRLRSATRSVAIVGAGEQSRRLVQLLRTNQYQPFHVHGVYADGPVTGAMQPSPGNMPDLDALLNQTRLGLVDDIIVALPWSEDQRIMDIVAKLRELPVNVYLASDLIGFRTQIRPPASHYESLPIHEVISKPMSGWDSVIKLVEDYVLGSLILVMVLPLLAVIAIVIKLDSRGPVLFRQKRIGFNNEVFDVFKFRSMYHANHVPDRTMQATRDDPRITRVGRFLRRWSLDELPQIFNVLNGTMSLVGPRPHALDHNEEFAQRTAGYFARHRVKPGITGLAQVKGFRGATDTAEKLDGRVRNDIYYAENWSLSLDFRILLQTIAVCIFGKNAY
jgi:putative colanic acid biosysnthesis UDP-glucose lipid carrier transferase